jgi:hypothetical protein
LLIAIEERLHITNGYMQPFSRFLGRGRRNDKPENGSYFILQIPALVPQGEGRGEGKNLAMQEVIAKALFPTAVFRLMIAGRISLIQRGETGAAETTGLALCRNLFVAGRASSNLG